MFTEATTTSYRSAADILVLNNDLDKFILNWTKIELLNKKATDSKLSEILVFNFKQIFSTDSNAVELREFLFKVNEVVPEARDYLHSRIHDLYLMILMRYPPWFIDMKVDGYANGLFSLSYDVDDDLVDKLQYAWLFSHIQFAIRYNQNQTHIYKSAQDH